MLKHTVVFFHLRELLLERFDEGVSVFEAGLLGVLLRDGLVGFCLLAFAFKLHFLHFFGLRLVTEISTLLV